MLNKVTVSILGEKINAFFYYLFFPVQTHALLTESDVNGKKKHEEAAM